MLRVGLVLTWLCVAPAIAAADRPTLWVLDLDGDGPGRELAVLMRDQASTHASAYALHDETDTVNRCGEDVGCLARAARDHSADFVIAGRLAAREGGFDAAMMTVEAATSRVVQRWQAFIPPHQIGRVDLRAWAATAYGALGDEPARPLPAAPPQDPQRRWKLTAAIGAGSTLVFATGFVYYLGKLRETGPGFQTDSSGQIVRSSSGVPIPGDGYGGYCQSDSSGKPLNVVIDQYGNMIPRPAACAHGSMYRDMTYVTGIAGVAAVGLTAVAAYRLLVPRESSPKLARRVIVTPVVAPDAAGAMLHIDW